MLPEIWDLLQQGQIESASQNANVAKRDSKQNADKIFNETRRLEAKINTLALISQALWELMKENTNLSEDDIEKKIAEIDLRDDRKDGQMTGKPMSCNRCNRPTHSKLKTCMYCGTDLGDPHIFHNA